MVELLSKRRSIRSYTDQEVCENHLNAIASAGLYSASSRSIRPWEFIIVTDPHMLEKLSAAKKHGSAFLAGAKAAFVILGIPGESDVWIEDTSIAASNMLLEAEALDLGACWIQIRERFDKQGTSSQEVVQELLGIPESRSVEAIIAVGHPAEKKNGYQAEDLLWDKVFIGHWGHER